MSSMFFGCSSLTSLAVSTFDTSRVTNMQRMFQNCSSLISLDLSNFNTANVTDMNSMFSNCINLTDLDVSKFDTVNVTDMHSMFSNCSSLINLDFRNATFSATSYGSMFSSVNHAISVIVKDDVAKIWIETRLSEANRTLSSVVAAGT